MPRIKRHSPSCHSTPTQLHANSGGTSQHASQGSPQSEPVVHSQNEVPSHPPPPLEPQNDPSSQPNAQSLSDAELDDTEGLEAEDPLLTTSKRKCNTMWTVNVIDEQGIVKETRLKVQDALALPRGKRVVTEWNRRGQPVGESGGLLGGFLGHVASNFNNFPIIYKNWHKVPGDYKQHVYETKIKNKFVVDDAGNKKYILQNLGKKWKDDKCRLFNDIYRPDLSWEDNLNLHPNGIPKEHWASFLEYKLSDEAQEMSQKNVANRQQQTIPHTLGSKTLARKQHELEIQSRREYSRGEMYPIAHKRKDGSFVNEEAQKKSEELEKEIDECSSENEAYAKVFGKEHSGYVRGMGFGVCPTQVLGSSSRSGVSMSSGDTPSRAEYESLKLQVQQLQEQLAFVVRQQGGHLSPANQVQPTDLGSRVEARRSSSASHDLQGHGQPSSSHQ